MFQLLRGIALIMAIILNCGAASAEDIYSGNYMVFKGGGGGEGRGGGKGGRGGEEGGKRGGREGERGEGRGRGGGRFQPYQSTSLGRYNAVS